MRMKLVALLSVAALAAVAQQAVAGSVTLGTAGDFAVLAGSTVTNTGSSVINGGDVGVYAGSAITGFGSVSGSYVTHTTDSVAQQAQSDLVTAYNAAAGRAYTTDMSGTDLGGLTLTPGIYFFSSSAFLTGTLTLNNLGDPYALFIFQIGSTLITGSNSSVVTINGGGSTGCGVYWQVGSSATIGTGTTFEGDILALTSISLKTGATLYGSALAQTGAVTLEGNTINNSNCYVDINGSGVVPGPGPTPAVPLPTSAALGLGLLPLGFLLVRRRRARHPHID